MAEAQTLTMPKTPDLSRLSRSMAGIDSLGANPRLAAAQLDSAWSDSKNSVIATAAAMQQPYQKTLRDLTNMGQISQDDPRHVAYQIAIFETVSADKAPKAEPQSTAMLAAQERSVMARLARQPESENAIGALISISGAQLSNEMEAKRDRQADAKRSRNKDDQR